MTDNTVGVRFQPRMKGVEASGIRTHKARTLVGSTTQTKQEHTTHKNTKEKSEPSLTATKLSTTKQEDKERLHQDTTARTMKLTDTNVTPTPTVDENDRQIRSRWEPDVNYTRQLRCGDGSNTHFGHTRHVNTKRTVLGDDTVDPSIYTPISRANLSDGEHDKTKARYAERQNIIRQNQTKLNERKENDNLSTVQNDQRRLETIKRVDADYQQRLEQQRKRDCDLPMALNNEGEKEFTLMRFATGKQQLPFQVHTNDSGAFKF